MESSAKSSFPMVTFIFLLGIVLLGVGTGYLLAQGITHKASPAVMSSSPTSKTAITKGSVYGSTDLATFKDTASGVLQTGGINGEGQFHLVRSGGDSQNVYLTSAVLDLSQFVGRKITVHGQTQKAQYAGWLMDVGQVEVLQ